MDDYLYFVDIKQDKYYISIQATERFAMSLNYINDGYKVYDKEVGDALKSMYKEHKVQLRFTWIF